MELLNAFLTDPASLPNDLAEGWVILLPTQALVDQADQFRPIVCGEVLLKILARLAVARIVSQWPVPQCCFGACRGRGVPEALYTVKACSQELGGMQDDTVFLQLDISSAFDSLQHRAILTFLRDHWCANTAKSSKIIHWILSHSVLKFQLFDTQWQVQQQVGTQQRASHSPVLFGRLVAAHFDKLCRGWVWQVNFLLSLQGNTHCGAFGTLMMPSAFSAMRHNLPVWSHLWFNAWRAWAST